MSRRFVPPAVAAFGIGQEAALAQAVLRAREEGFTDGRLYGQQEGHHAGREEGAAQAREALTAELDRLRSEYAKLDQQISVAAALHRMVSARAADLAALEAATRAAAAAALQALFPVLVSRAAGMEINALLQDALTERAAETLRLHAHPDTLKAIVGEGGVAAEAGRLVLTADAALPPGAAEIAWTGGGLTFDPAALLGHVVAMLEAAPLPAAATLPPSTPSSDMSEETPT